MMIIEYLSFGIGVVGVSVIIWGTLLSMISLVRLEAIQIRGKTKCHKREMVRHHFGSYILLGLEFLIAADIVNTIIKKPSLREVAILGSIVVIRTILSFFLSRELSLHTCDMPAQEQAKKKH